MRFLDTNVLLYSIGTRPEELSKRNVAIGLLEGRDIALSVQVLQEFYYQATRQGRADALSHRDVAPSFYPAVSSFRRLVGPCRAG